MFPFEIECYVYRRPNLRTDALEMEAYMGRNVLDAIFDRMEMQPAVTTLFLSFPERWLNIIEQRQLYERLQHYCPNLTKLTMKTHSVYIIQCTRGTQLRLMDDIPEGENQLDIHAPQFTDNQGNVFNMGGITVIR